MCIPGTASAQELLTDFGTLEGADNDFTKSYANLMCVSLLSQHNNHETNTSHNFSAFGALSKKRLLVMNAFKWSPTGFTAWALDGDKSPGMVRLRENEE